VQIFVPAVFFFSKDVKSIDQKDWLCLTVWNTNNPSLAAMCLHSLIIVCLAKYFFTAALTAYSIQMFFSYFFWL
jgi:hypothetical protein